MVGKIIENLAMSSGGIKCISFCGVIRALEDLNKMATIKRFSGSSAGSIFAAFLACGYTSKDLIKIFKNRNLEEIRDNNSNMIQNVFRLMFNFGFYTCDNFYIWIGTCFEEKGNNKDITFQEIYDMYGKELVITGTHLNTMKTIYFSTRTTPDMIVRDAIRISVCIPLFLEPINDGGELYADGGIMCKCPIAVFQEIDKNLRKTLAVCAQSSIEFQSHYEFTNIFQFLQTILYAVLRQAEAYTYKKIYQKKTIYINTKKIDCIDFSISEINKTKLILCGYKKTIKYFRKKLM